MSIEVRRESFVIHPDKEAWARHQEENDCNDPHPEFYLSDLDDLIKALVDARDYVKNHR